MYDEEIIKSFIDRRPTLKVMEELHSLLLDRQAEHLIKRSIASKKYNAIIPNASTVHSLDNDGYFKSLGISSKDDLLTDNFGTTITLLVAQSETSPSLPMTDVTGSSFNFKMKGVGPMFNTTTVGQCQIQLGSGSTTVALSDFGIETALVTAPESARVNFTNNSGYSGGVTTFIENVGPFGATETVRESAIFVEAQEVGNLTKIICLARYNYTDTQIGISNTAVVSTTISI